jgi:hypothetical protein
VDGGGAAAEGRGEDAAILLRLALAAGRSDTAETACLLLKDPRFLPSGRLCSLRWRVTAATSREDGLRVRAGAVCSLHPADWPLRAVGGLASVRSMYRT